MEPNRLRCPNCGNEALFVSASTCQANVNTTYEQIPEGRLVRRDEETEVLQVFDTYYKCGKCKRVLPPIPDWEQRVSF